MKRHEIIIILLAILIFGLCFWPFIISADDTTYFRFDRDKNFVELKYYPPHNEWTPAPGAAQVGVDRWSATLNMEVDIVRSDDWALLVGGSGEWHYMVDWPSEVESGYSGDLRAVSARWHGGVRWKDTIECRVFHGREVWYPSSREYSRYLYTGLGLRMYFGE